MSLETEVTKGFLVSLQLCFYGDLREKKLLREWDREDTSPSFQIKQTIEL